MINNLRKCSDPPNRPSSPLRKRAAMSRKKLCIQVHNLTKLFAKERGMDEKLCGCCGISAYILYESMYIWDQLYNTTYDPSLMIGFSDYHEGKRYIHSWVKSNNVIYDPSFLQFDSRIPYFIGNNTPQHAFLSHNITKATTFDDFVTWQTEQMPSQEIMEWFMSKLDFSHPNKRHRKDLQQLKSLILNEGFAS